MTITLDMATTMNAPSLRSRITARLGARHLDRLLVTGANPEPGSALDVHMMRLSATAYREQLAAELRRRATVVLCDRVLTSRAKVPTVWGAADLIERVEKRLQSRHASPRGIARLRRLLADWNGPLHRRGGGDLCSELRATLAAL